jgi:excisionase family DNA binding protein
MKPRPTQFGVRENTASSRQHASRSAVETHSTAICTEDSPETHLPSSDSERPVRGLENTQDTAAASAATGRERRDENHLLNVREVAELLRVPMSWVYGRMRKRSFERIPAYRVGKYWRFRANEVMLWLHEGSRQSGPDQTV